MSGRPVKRSLTLRGHRTSVSLEDAFWKAFRQMARADGKALNALAAEIDAARDSGRGYGTGAVGLGLASSIRVYILERLQAERAETPERA